MNYVDQVQLLCHKLLLLHRTYLICLEHLLYRTMRVNSAGEFQLISHMLLMLHHFYLN